MPGTVQAAQHSGADLGSGHGTILKSHWAEKEGVPHYLSPVKKTVSISDCLLLRISAECPAQPAELDREWWSCFGRRSKRELEYT